MGKPQDWGKLDTYIDKDKEETTEKKEGLFSKLWNKTVFPEKIARAKAEKSAREKMEHEAKVEAIKELKPDIKNILKEKYKQEMINKMTGQDKQGKMKKFGNAFKIGGEGGFDTTEKINRMLGSSDLNKEKETKGGVGGFDTTDKINRMLGSSDSNKEKETKGGVGGFDTTDKINRMLGTSDGTPNGTPNGKDNKNKEKETNEEKIKRMLG